jgi:hypothetical protein
MRRNSLNQHNEQARTGPHLANFPDTRKGQTKTCFACNYANLYANLEKHVEMEVHITHI